MKSIKNIIAKYKTVPISVKSAIAFTISSFILRGIAFISTPIFTRLMDTTQYGIVSTYNSWQTIIEVFALLGLTSAGVFNVGMNDYKDSRDQYMSSTLLLCNTATVITFAIIFMLQSFCGNEFILPNNLLILMFIQFLFSPAQIFWITRQRYEYKYKLAVCITIISTIVTQVVSVLCVMYADETTSAEMKLWGNGISALVFYIPIYLYIFLKGRTGYNYKIWKQTLIFALPLIPHYLAQHIMAGADRIMIANMVSQAEAGIYSVISAISLIASVIWNAINASLTPFIFEKVNEKKYKEINNVVLQIIMMYAVMCCGVALIAPEILMILAPEEYYFGVYAVPPIAGVAFLSALYNIYSTIEFYHKKSSNIATATIVSCVINIILNFIFIPQYGFIAAAYTTLVSNMILILMHYIGYRKCQKERIYNDFNFLLVAVICIIVCQFCNLLYMNTIIRYSIVGIIMVVIVWKRNVIINKLKALKNK